MNTNVLSILGIQTELKTIPRQDLRGLNTDQVLRLSYYTIKFSNQEICVVHPKGTNNYTPMQWRKTTEQISSIVQKPVAVWLDALPYYERERLIMQGVYFIVSDKYAFLPSIVANVKAKRNIADTKFSPAAQYILLYYLQNDMSSSFTLKELEAIVPYNYLAISRAVSVLENAGLCSSQKKDAKTKLFSFVYGKKELWQKSQAYFISPVKRYVYADKLPEHHSYYVCGVNALSEYSHLNPDEQECFAVCQKCFQGETLQVSEIEGKYMLEIWNYPPIPVNGMKPTLVDKLSLYLSMSDSKDARIEKELEIIIEEIQW